jgi:trypsin-like peptidase
VNLANYIDGSLADELEQVAPRARKLFGALASANEQHRAAIGPPGEIDVSAISARLRAAMAQSLPSELVPGERDPCREADAIAANLVERARLAMAMLAGGGSPGALTDQDALALEAVILTRGRPALRVEGMSLEEIDPVKHPGSGFWRGYINDHEDDLTAVAAATGAIKARDVSSDGESGPWVQGSAWLIGGNFAVTNRHVLVSADGAPLFRRLTGQPTVGETNPEYDCLIDFAFDNGPGRAARYTILDAPFISRDDDPIDVAILRVEPIAGNDAAPAPLTVSRANFGATALYIVGHPGKLSHVPDNTAAVFGTPDERKRVSLGEVMAPDPARPFELRHDASTIGGYSGGCVLGFLSREVIGLHYFGETLKGNRAFTAQALRAHPVASFLG